jgi:hypothetical protein
MMNWASEEKVTEFSNQSATEFVALRPEVSTIAAGMVFLD